jgi:hypothetical protein
MTVVEWLVEQLINIDRPNYTNRRILAISKNSLQEKEFNELVEQAKEMEKQQIIDAYEQGSEDGYWHPENGYSNKFETSEQYYNETFKPE